MGMFSSLFGGGGSAKRAADVAASKQSEAGQIIQDQYQQSRQDYAPYVEAGTSALGQYQGLLPGLAAPTQEMYNLALTVDPIVEQIRNAQFDYTKSPGYEFRFGEGQRALESSAAAKGGLFSGATGRELTRYGQDYATAEYDNYINRLRNQIGDVSSQMAGRQAALGAQYNQLNAYSPLINTGYGATSALGSLGANAASGTAAYKAGEGASYASGMQAKDAQMQAAGEQWIQLGAMAAGGAMGGAGMLGGAGGAAGALGGAQAFGSMAGSVMGGSGGGTPALQPYGTPTMGGSMPYSTGYSNPFMTTAPQYAALSPYYTSTSPSYNTALSSPYLDQLSQQYAGERMKSVY